MPMGQDPELLSSDPAASELLSSDPTAGRTQQKQPSKQSAGAPSALGLSAIPAGANIAARIATAPGLPATMSGVGQAVGGLSSIAGAGLKMAHGNPLGAAESLMLTGPAIWGGGKGGWFTGKALQRVAPPVASGLEKVAPFASRLQAAQGPLELAQMAAPKRRDIGFMGIGPKVDIGELSNPNPTGKTYPSPSPSEQVQWVRDHIMQLLGK